MKDYDYNGLAGCVVQRVSKKTGHLVGVYNNAQAGFDDDGGAMPWSTLCEPHSHVIAHRTLALAREHLGDPTGWCEDCTAEERARESGKDSGVSKDLSKSEASAYFR